MTPREPSVRFTGALSLLAILTFGLTADAAQADGDAVGDVCDPRP